MVESNSNQTPRFGDGLSFFYHKIVKSDEQKQKSKVSLIQHKISIRTIHRKKELMPRKSQ